MRQRAIRWLAALALAVVLGVNTVVSVSQPPVAHGEGTPTPTPTETTDGQPGGDGGGH